MGFYVNSYKGEKLPTRGKHSALLRLGARQAQVEDMLTEDLVCCFDPGQPWDCAAYVGTDAREATRLSDAISQGRIGLFGWLVVPGIGKEIR